MKPLDQRTDPDIAKDAVHVLQTHTSVPSQVKVTVRNGFLTLEGTVEWMYQRLAAEAAVKGLKGQHRHPFRERALVGRKGGS